MHQTHTHRSSGDATGTSAVPSGTTGEALNIPEGYAHQIDGQTFLDAPVSARKMTWGKLKNGYR